MIRIYFVFDNPLDDGVTLSYIDVPTQEPAEAFWRVAKAAESGALWRSLYPDEDTHPYTLIECKMLYLNISTLANEQSAETTLIS